MFLKSCSCADTNSLDVLLVGLGLARVLLLLGLVTNGVLGGRGTAFALVSRSAQLNGLTVNSPSADGGVAVLGDFLIGFL